MSYIATTLEGLEPITEKEVKGKTILPGKVKCTSLPKSTNTIEQLYELLDHITFKSLEDITNNLKILSKLKEKTYNLVCNREGKHSFKSIDVQIKVAEVLRKNKIVVDFKIKDPTLYIDIKDKDCLVGILIKKDCQKRMYRVKLVADTLPPLIAHAAVLCAKLKKQETLLDPFTTDGIIGIEAALVKDVKVFGFGKNTRNARINAKVAKVNLELGEYDLDWLDTKFDKKSCTIITYLPSPSKTKAESMIKSLYTEFFHQADFIVKERMVLVVRRLELLEEFLTHFKKEAHFTVKSGDNTYHILALKKTI